MIQILLVQAKFLGHYAAEIAKLSLHASPEATAEIEKASADILRAKSSLYRAKEIMEAEISEKVS